jgi:enoyl-[acyl-carrier protein] reductase I
MSGSSSSRKIALVMGVANQRSIAWSCVESLHTKGWQVIFTYQTDKMQSKMEPLLHQHSNVLGGFACDVTTDLDSSSSSSSVFQQRLADLLQDRPLHAVVHSLAHAPNLKTTPSLLETSAEDFLKAHEISAYSLLSVARETKEFLKLGGDNNSSSSSSTSTSASSTSRSITALSYLGAVRAVPGYNMMGPAKASLESLVRGLALELAADTTTTTSTRVNAISAGPLATVSAKGGIANFSAMRDEMTERAPLGNVTAHQVASAVAFLASEDASGITGQTLYVDGGYSMVGGPPPCAPPN